MGRRRPILWSRAVALVATFVVIEAAVHWLTGGGPWDLYCALFSRLMWGA